MKENRYVEFAASTVFLDGPYKCFTKILKKKGKKIFPSALENVAESMKIIITGFGNMPSTYNVPSTIYSQLNRAIENQYFKS